MKIVVQGQEFEVQPGAESVNVGGTDYPVRIVRQGEIITVYVNERPYHVQFTAAAAEGPAKVLVDAKEYEVEMKGTAAGRRPAAGAPKRSQRGGAGAITSQMTGLNHPWTRNPADR
jgi:hypothetical protein